MEGRQSCFPEVKEGRLGVKAAEKWGEDRKSNSCPENAGVIRESEITAEEGVR